MNILAGEGWDRLCPFLREASAARRSARSFSRARLTFGTARAAAASRRAPRRSGPALPWVDPRKRALDREELPAPEPRGREGRRGQGAAVPGKRLTKRYRCRMNVTFEYWRDNNCSRTMFPKRFGRNATPTRVSALSARAARDPRRAAVERRAARVAAERRAAAVARRRGRRRRRQAAAAAETRPATTTATAAELAAKAALDALRVDPDPHEAAADAASPRKPWPRSSRRDADPR